MQISVKSDVKELTRKLNRIQKKQIPYATEKALNDTAFDARAYVMKSMHRYLDRPRKTTVSTVRVKKAHKKKGLVAKVGFPGKDRDLGTTKWAETPAEIMQRQIAGGTRRPKKKSLAVPTRHFKTNQFGNIPRNKINTMLANKDKFFSGIPKGIDGLKNAGIWERMPPNSRRKGGKGMIRMAIAWEPKAEYSKRFPFNRVVEASVKKTFRKNFDLQLKRALATAR